jgi:hypothetical protein
MKRGAEADTKEFEVAFEALAGRQGGRGIFAIEDAAEEMARRTKLAHIAEQMRVRIGAMAGTGVGVRSVGVGNSIKESGRGRSALTAARSRLCERIMCVRRVGKRVIRWMSNYS